MYKWSKLSSKKWLDAWEERFYGNPNVVISEIKGGKSIRVEAYCEDEASALIIKEQFGGSVTHIKQQNWVAMSAKESEPLKIRDVFLLSNSTQSSVVEQLRSENPKKKVIQIPAEMAFGTGDHATTATCLRLLTDIAKERKQCEWQMIDLGCGTAVLAIAAKMMGASACEAHDFDPQAVSVSEKNCVLNEVDKITVKQQDVLEWKPKQKWDVVVANMFSTILQEAFPVLRESVLDDGDVIVSGILADQWEVTKLSGEKVGFEFIQVIQKGKWVTARAKVNISSCN